MLLRHGVAVLAAAAVLSTAAVPTAVAAHPTSKKSDELPDGLYGAADPRYDGVWRQSVALLALAAADTTPSAKAVDWLTGQQCDDGSFPAHRTDTEGDCGEETPADTNATALAVQALTAGGRTDDRDAVENAVKWLKSEQNKDGGWGHTAGSPSDANSVSVAIGALAAAGEDPRDAQAKDSGKTPYDALQSFQLGCDAKPREHGAFAHQPGEDGGLAANDDASAAASLAATGQGMLLSDPLDDKGGSRPVEPLQCGRNAGGHESAPGPREAAAAGNSYLASVVKENGGRLTSPAPGSGEAGTPDWANTADTVIALSAGGHRSEADYALRALEKGLASWDKAEDDPAAIGSVMLARHAAGHDAATGDGGTDLLKRLNATGPDPARIPEEKNEESGGDSGFPLWSMVLVGLAAGAGIGFLLSGRRRKQS